MQTHSNKTVLVHVCEHAWIVRVSSTRTDAWLRLNTVYISNGQPCARTNASPHVTAHMQHHAWARRIHDLDHVSFMHRTGINQVSHRPRISPDRHRPYLAHALPRPSPCFGEASGMWQGGFGDALALCEDVERRQAELDETRKQFF